jgi:uncharacterized membrane protein YphA (DoxX/SURF4 family)
MERVLGRFSPQFYALMRIVVGLLFACHGAQKLFGLFGGHRVALVSQLGLAGIIEFVGGLMIAVGFLTASVAFVASGEMAYAFFTRHLPRGSRQSRTAERSRFCTASSSCISRRGEPVSAESIAAHGVDEPACHRRTASSG